MTTDDDIEDGAPACYGNYRDGSVDCEHCDCYLDCKEDSLFWDGDTL